MKERGRRGKQMESGENEEELEKAIKIELS